MKERLDVLREINDHIGDYYSRDFVRRNILRQSDQEIKEMDRQITKEREKGLLPDKTPRINGERILMKDARNFIDLLENAPDEVSSTFLKSLLSTKALDFVDAHTQIVKEEAAAKDPEPKAEKAEADSQGDKDDQTLDPDFQKNFTSSLLNTKVK